MVFHDPKIHGPMKLRFITTLVMKDKDSAAIRELLNQHEDTVNKFNELNQVFFNQDMKVIECKDSERYFVTPCLYVPIPAQQQASQSSLPQLNPQR